MKKFLICFFLLPLSANCQLIDEEFNDQYNLAVTALNTGDYDGAQAVFFDLLKKLDSTPGDSKEAHIQYADTYSQIASNYLFSNDSLCLFYIDKSLYHAQLGEDLVTYYDCFRTKHYFARHGYFSDERLLEISDSCIAFTKELNDKGKIAEAYQFKVSALGDLGDEKGVSMYLDSVNLYIEYVEEPAFLFAIHNELGYTLAQIGNDQAALRHFNLAMENAIIYGSTVEIAGAAFNVGLSNYALENFEEAAENLLIYIDSSDVYVQNMLESNFTEANAKFETEKKDKEIAIQNEELLKNELEIANQKSTTSFIIYGAVILILLLLALYQAYLYRQNKVKAKIESELSKEQEFNKLRTEFLENIAHEIRTPITLINGYLMLAEDQIDDPKKAKDHIQKALNSSHKVLENASEILELLKLEKGKLPVIRSDIQLNDFLRRSFYSFDSLAQLKRVELKYFSEVPADSVVSMDENRVEKIINNLLSNAIKFSPSNAEIQMIVTVSKGMLTLKVIDNGPGIPAHEHEAVFKRFYQSKAVSSPGGVGVGLALAKDFAISMGGDLVVGQSSSKGSCFVWTTPLRELEQKRTQAPREKTYIQNVDKLQDASKTTKILVVEDNPEMNAYLVQILSNNYNVDFAFDGIEALEKLSSKKFNLIISDVMMPNMDGFELRENVNKLENYRNVPQIFLTAKNSLDDRLKGFELGVDEYLAKPFSKEELLVRIKNLLTTKQTREEWVQDNLEFLGEEDQTAEEKTISKINKIILKNLSNEDFSIPELSQEVGYSQRQLARILNKSTGLSPVKYVLELRLQRAYTLLIEKRFNSLSEVRHEVGISSASHFNSKFKERFGVKPSEV